MHDALPEGLRPRLFGPRRLVLIGAALGLGALGLGSAWWSRIHMPGTSYEGPLRPLRPAQARLARQLEADVRALSALGERSLARPAALDAGGDLVEQRLRATGHTVERQEYRVDGHVCANLRVRLPGEREDDVVVVGAHYDSAHGTAGANDNGSGVAALLALAERFPPGYRGARTLELVAFTNEEMPHFEDGTMGSMWHARELAKGGDRVVAMLSLETLGHYDVREGSQRYPFPYSLLYPSRGDFVGFVGDRSSAPLVRATVATFRAHALIPSEGAALPPSVPGVGWSDHRSYWAYGWPALMVTDTALFRDPHYHRPSDTPDHLDYERLALVVEGLEPVVRGLAEARFP